MESTFFLTKSHMDPCQKDNFFPVYWSSKNVGEVWQKSWFKWYFSQNILRALFTCLYICVFFFLQRRIFCGRQDWIECQESTKCRRFSPIQFFPSAWLNTNNKSQPFVGEKLMWKFAFCQLPKFPLEKNLRKKIRLLLNPGQLFNQKND